MLAKVCVAHSSAGNFELLLKSYSSVTSISCMLCVYKMQEPLKLKVTCFPILETLSIFFGTCYVMTVGMCIAKLDQMYSLAYTTALCNGIDPTAYTSLIWKEFDRIFTSAWLPEY